MPAIDVRPTVGKLVVPYMVDATRSPIDFKALDQAHVAQCAARSRCGICGSRIRSGPIAFIGPDDGRTCFADPWMHPACAKLALEPCPFLGGGRDWRRGAGHPMLRSYRPGSLVIRLAFSWLSHRDAAGRLHFEALGTLFDVDGHPVGPTRPGTIYGGDDQDVSPVGETA